MNGIRFSLNQICAPGLSVEAFLDLALATGCTGVELRNDLADKRLSKAAFLDGRTPEEVGRAASDRGLDILGLSEVYGFDRWSPEMHQKVVRLATQANACGAGSISLIPSNDGPYGDPEARDEAFTRALSEIVPILERAGNLVALVEPLGFLTSSLRRKREAVDVIDRIGGQGRFQLVHDTFHHHIADEMEWFPDRTGIVHISGIADPALSKTQMQDAHRGLVEEMDRLNNIQQIQSLVSRGYEGFFSLEPFSPAVHRLPDAASAIRKSLDHLRQTVGIPT